MTIEVIKFRDVLPVNFIPRVLNELSSPAVELKGEDFRSAEKVFINDVESPEIVIVDKKTLYAQVPDGVQSIRTVSVLSHSFTQTAVASKVIFQLGQKTKAVSGLVKLTQLFLKILLQSPGSDIFDQDMGGGLQDLVGRLSTSSRTESLLSAVTQSIAKTEAQIRRYQLNSSGLPLSERLLTAKLVDIRFGQSQDEAIAKVQLDNVAGQSGVAALEL